MFALNQNFLKRIFLFVAILGVGFSSYSQNTQRPLPPLEGLSGVTRVAIGVVERNPNIVSYVVQAVESRQVASCAAAGVAMSALMVSARKEWATTTMKLLGVNMALMTKAHSQLKTRNPSVAGIFDRDLQLFNQNTDALISAWSKCSDLVLNIMQNTAGPERVWAVIANSPYRPIYEVVQ